MGLTAAARDSTTSVGSSRSVGHHPTANPAATRNGSVGAAARATPMESPLPKGHMSTPPLRPEPESKVGRGYTDEEDDEDESEEEEKEGKQEKEDHEDKEAEDE